MHVLRVFIAIALTAGPLGAIADDEQVAELIDELQHASSRDSSDAAAALGKLGEAAKPAVPALIEALKDHRDFGSNPFGPVRSTVSYRATESLVEIGGAAVPDLLTALEREDEEIRESVIDILGRIGKPAAAALPRLKEFARSDPEESVRCDALLACSKIEPSAEANVRLLVEALKDESPEVRSLAAQILGQLGPKASSAVQPLIGTLFDDGEVAVAFAADASYLRPIRFDAAQALGKIGGAAKPARKRLLRMMKDDPDKQVRVSAALAVFRIDDGNDAAMQSLIRSLDDGGFFYSAQDALAELGRRASPAFEALVESLKYESEFSRMASIRALAAIGDRKAVPILISMLDDENSQVRSAAAESLGRFGKAAAPAVPRLIQLLDDEDIYSWDRDHVIATLGKIGPGAKPALPALQKLAASPDGEDEQALAEAIRKISGDK